MKICPEASIGYHFLSGQAGPVSIKSSPDGDEKTKFALEWVAQSITPITEFKLQYRRVAESYIVQTSVNDVADNSWTEVSVTPMNNGDHFYSGKYVIQSLDPASHYIARISSNNAYGYGPHSTPFRFATKGAGTVTIEINSYHIIIILSLCARQ